MLKEGCCRFRAVVGRSDYRRETLHCGGNRRFQTRIRCRREPAFGFKSQEELDAAVAEMIQEEMEREHEETVRKLWEDAESNDDDDFSHGPDHKSGFAAIIGLPNVGKSTLLNSLLGQKLSIVTRKAQTTRNRIFGILSAKQHQLVLLDNPGLLTRTQNALHERMMSFIRKSVQDSDVILIVIDAANAPIEDLEMIQLPAEWNGPPVGVVLNKSDLVSDSDLKQITEWYVKNCRCKKVFLTNAKAGEGVEDVREWLVEELPLGPPLYPKDDVSQQSERFFVSEIIREHVFLRYEDEIPYNVQVNVVDYKEREETKDFIFAEIVTERPNQKAILLGKNGSAIKALGLAARREIERFLEKPVYLELSVVTVKGWRKNPSLLEAYGY